MCTSIGNDKVVVFPKGDPLQAIEYTFPYTGAAPFGMAIAPRGGAWVTASGGLRDYAEEGSSLVKLELKKDTLVETFRTQLGNRLRVVEVDSLGNAWVASLGDNTIYGFTPKGESLGGYHLDNTPKGFTGGGVKGPWGLCIDGEDHVWVGNFGPLMFFSKFSEGGVSNIWGGVSKICGANPKTWPPGKKTGDPLSPASRFTVQSAGEPVLLHDGSDLYSQGTEGKGDDEISYAPIMRTTSVQIDQAGNLWNANNWKPNFNTDVGFFGIFNADGNPIIEEEASNPFGDGIIIYVGLAPPPPSPKKTHESNKKAAK